MANGDQNSTLRSKSNYASKNMSRQDAVGYATVSGSFP